LANAIRSLNASVHGNRPPRRFTSESIGVLLERQAEYVEELGLEAVRIARRAKSDVVSANDIQRADEVVRSAERTRRSRLYETIGGILVGGGLAQLYAQIALGHQATTAGWVVAVVSAAAGLVVLTYSFAMR
jgi:histone H3/H4